MVFTWPRILDTVFSMFSLAREATEERMNEACDGVNLQGRTADSSAKSQIFHLFYFFFLPGLGWRYSVVLDKRSNTDLLVTSIF